MTSKEKQLYRRFRQSLKPPTGEACVREDELWDLHQSRLDGAERERVSNHLLNCARCAEEFRQFEIFMQEPEPLTKRELDHHWKAFQRNNPEIQAKIGLKNLLLDWMWPPALFRGIALGVAAGIVLMTFWPNGGSPGSIEVNPLPVELYPEEIGLQSGGDNTSAVSLRGSTSAVLLLRTNYLDLPDEATARLEIRDLEGKVLHSVGGLRLQSPGYFALTIGPDGLPHGYYRLVLFVSGERDPVAVYRLLFQ